MIVFNKQLDRLFSLPSLFSSINNPKHCWAQGLAHYENMARLGEIETLGALTGGGTFPHSDLFCKQLAELQEKVI
jgi:hypothetical protein